MRGAQILVIEDNPHDVRMLQYGLDQHDQPYSLQVLSDGEQALEFVKDQRQTTSPLPCVIVLDLYLPKHRGIEVLRAIADVPRLSHVSVVLLTSCSSPVEEQQALDLGASLFKTKPFDVNEWVSIAGEILELCKSKRTLS